MSFRREAHVPKGGPDGGDGGRGGNVVVRGRRGRVLAHRVPLQAPLQGRARHARQGQPQCTAPPARTLCSRCPWARWCASTSRSPRRRASSSPTSRTTASASPWPRAAMGGRGNIHFVTPTRRAPAFAELGEPVPGGLDRAGDEAHGRRGPRGHAERRQVVAHREDERGAPEDRRLSRSPRSCRTWAWRARAITASSWPTSPGLSRVLTRAAAWGTSSCAISSARRSSCTWWT